MLLKPAKLEKDCYTSRFFNLFQKKENKEDICILMGVRQKSIFTLNKFARRHKKRFSSKLGSSKPDCWTI